MMKTFLLLALLSVHASADDHGAYIQLGIGQDHHHPDLASGASIVDHSASYEQSRASFGFGVGYRFNRFVAVQVNSNQLGSHDARYPLFGLNTTYKLRADDARLVLEYPLDGTFSIGGSVGAANTKMQNGDLGDARKTTPVIGLHGRARLGEHLYAAAELLRYSNFAGTGAALTNGSLNFGYQF